MHVQVSESYKFVSHFISLCSRGGGGGGGGGGGFLIEGEIIS